MPTLTALLGIFQQAFDDFNSGCNNPGDATWNDIANMLDDDAVVCAITHGIVARGKINALNFLKASGGTFDPISCNAHVAPDGSSGTTTGQAHWKDSNHPGRVDLIHYVFSFVDDGTGNWSIFTLSATSD